MSPHRIRSFRGERSDRRCFPGGCSDRSTEWRLSGSAEISLRCTNGQCQPRSHSRHRSVRGSSALKEDHMVTGSEVEVFAYSVERPFAVFAARSGCDPSVDTRRCRWAAEDEFAGQRLSPESSHIVVRPCSLTGNAIPVGIHSIRDAFAFPVPNRIHIAVAQCRKFTAREIRVQTVGRRQRCRRCG